LGPENALMAANVGYFPLKKTFGNDRFYNIHHYLVESPHSIARIQHDYIFYNYTTISVTACKIKNVHTQGLTYV